MSVLTDVAGEIINRFSTDVVAIYNQSGEQVFADGVPMRASVSQRAKAFTHPLETSVEITDHRVILQTEISLILFLKNQSAFFGFSQKRLRDVYAQISQSFRNADLLSVQTRAGRFDNLIIQALPHDENPEMFEAIDVELKLLETQFVSLVIVNLTVEDVTDPYQSSTSNLGVQSPQTPQSSIAARAFDSISGYLQ